MQLVSLARVLFCGWLEVRGLRRRFGRGEVVRLGVCGSVGGSGGWFEWGVRSRLHRMCNRWRAAVRGRAGVVADGGVELWSRLCGWRAALGLES